MAAAAPRRHRTPAKPSEALCRLRCGDHGVLYGTRYLPEGLLRLVVRCWTKIASFEKEAAKECDRFAPKDFPVPAPFVRWNVPAWADLRAFMREHANDTLQLVTKDGEVKPVLTTFGQLLPGYGRSYSDLERSVT